MAGWLISPLFGTAYFIDKYKVFSYDKIYQFINCIIGAFCIAVMVFILIHFFLSGLLYRIGMQSILYIFYLLIYQISLGFGIILILKLFLVNIFEQVNPCWLIGVFSVGLFLKQFVDNALFENSDN
jgi:hypothetical protein